MEKNALRMVFIDTQFVIAVGNERDQHHKRATELTESCSGSRFVITEPVILEIGNALASKAKTYAIEKIDQFLESDDVDLVRLTPDLFDEGYALYKTHRDKEWGLVDCI